MIRFIHPSKVFWDIDAGLCRVNWEFKREMERKKRRLILQRLIVYKRFLSRMNKWSNTSENLMIAHWILLHQLRWISHCLFFLWPRIKSFNSLFSLYYTLHLYSLKFVFTRYTLVICTYNYTLFSVFTFKSHDLQNFSMETCINA